MSTPKPRGESETQMSTTIVRPRGVVFAAWEVDALKAGRKTMFRRPMKPQPTLPHFHQLAHVDGSVGGLWTELEPPGGGMGESRWCPWKPGDVLYVKETWAPRLNPNGRDDANQHYVKYRSDGGEKSPHDENDWHHWPDRWRSSTSMPAWASRFALTVESVRVGRVQAISEADAIAEGMDGRYVKGVNGKLVACEKGRPGRTPVEQYAAQYNATDGAGSWDRNDFVWAVTFTAKART